MRKRSARGFHLQTLTSEENAKFVEQLADAKRWTRSEFIDYLLTIFRELYEDSGDFNNAIQCIATYRTYMQTRSQELTEDHQRTTRRNE